MDANTSTEEKGREVEPPKRHEVRERVSDVHNVRRSLALRGRTGSITSQTAVMRPHVPPHEVSRPLKQAKVSAAVTRPTEVKPNRAVGV